MHVSALSNLRGMLLTRYLPRHKGELELSHVYTEQLSPYVDDGEPWHHLKARGFRQKSGLLKSSINHRWNDDDREAVQYLCNEWGWTWSGQEV